MFRTKLFALFSVAVALGSVSSIASANDQDVWATTVPASSCQPIDNSQVAKVRLSNSAWVFSGSNTGTVQFYCPLPINAFTVSDFSNDNDISAFRVYYRDTDGLGSAASVTARLVYRRYDGLYSGGSTWTSNVSAATGNTTAIHSNSHDVRSSALYSFYVTLYRANTSQDPAFSGLDFPFPTVP